MAGRSHSYENELAGLRGGEPAGVAVHAPARGSRIFRLLSTAVITLAFGWVIVTHTLAAYLAKAAPEWALRLAPDNPEALMNIAEARLNKLLAARHPQAPDEAETSPRLQAFANPALNRILPKRLAAENADPDADTNTRASHDAPPVSDEAAAAELAEIEKLAERALLHEPMSSRAIRIMGQVAEESGHEDRAATLMREAAHRSLNETIAVYSMLMRAAAAKDYDNALFYADAMLRSRPQLLTVCLPVLTQIAEQPDASELLVKRLAARPIWRSPFLANIVSNIKDARTPLWLLQKLKATDAPPTNDELANYLNFLVGKRFDELAYYTWLQFLPPERLASIRNVFNGDFSSNPTGLVFDWVITPSTNATVEIAGQPDDEGNRGLRIEFGSGRVQLGRIAQRLMLPPGDYVLRYRYRGETVGRRGLKWKLACAAQTNDPLLDSPMFQGVQRSWRTTDIDFIVPISGCQSQELRLVHDSRSTSEEYVSGTAWYDDVEIVRAAPASDQTARQPSR